MDLENIKKQIDDLGLKEQKELYSYLQNAMEKQKKQAKTNAIKKMKELAQETGLDFDDLMKEHYGIDNSDGRKNKLPPKYMHPDDPEKTWTGRGRPPAWMSKYMEEHADYNDKEDFLINKTEDQ